MRAVWKFHVPVQDSVLRAMPTGAEVLCVQLQKGQPCVWALVDEQAPVVQREFNWRGTGHPMGNAGRYVGTVQLADGALVFHLFVGSES